jgi:hypothetical protein
MRMFTATLTALLLAGCAFAQDWNVSVKTDTNGVLRAPLAAPFAASNNLATVTAVNASNAVQDASLVATSTADRAYALGLVTNASIASSNYTDTIAGGKVSTNEMGDGLTYTNGQWIVTSQGTVTNVSVNGIAGVVTNAVAELTLDAEDVGALGTNVAFETWTNPAAASSLYITNAVVNGTNGVVSNGMVYVTITTGDTDDRAWTNYPAMISATSTADRAYAAGLTNGFVTASITNGLVTASITNGLL